MIINALFIPSSAFPDAVDLASDTVSMLGCNTLKMDLKKPNAGKDILIRKKTPRAVLTV